jgi:hypothetical protein
MHSSLDEHLYEINYICDSFFIKLNNLNHASGTTIGDTENWADVSFICQNF